jgi:hypothetical protein
MCAFSSIKVLEHRANADILHPHEIPKHLKNLFVGLPRLTISGWSTNGVYDWDVVANLLQKFDVACSITIGSEGCENNGEFLLCQVEASHIQRIGQV